MRRRALAAALLLSACGSFEPTAEGVVFLDIIAPPVLTVAVGGALQFQARALDAKGEPVDVPITWRTPDPAVVEVDGSGRVTGLAAGTGRVQAVVGSEGGRLRDFVASDFVAVTVQAAP